MAFTSVVVVFSTLQYHHGIVVSETDNEATALLQVSMFTVLIVVIFTSLLVIFGKQLINLIYGHKEMGQWLWLAPVSVFFQGLNLIFSAWAIRRKKFKLLSFNRISTAILAPVFSIAFGLLVANALGLFIGLIISQVIPTFRMLYHFIRTEPSILVVNRVHFNQTAKKHLNYPRFTLPSAALNIFSNQMPMIILSHLGGPQAVGWYSISARMLGLPSSLIATSIGDVFRQSATLDYFQKGSCRPLFLKMFRSLLFMAIIPFMVIVIFGPSIFSIFFGEQWRQAGVIAQVLAILYFAKFAVSPLSTVALIANKQWVGLVIDIILLMTLSLMFCISLKYNLSYMVTLGMFSVSYSLLYLLTFTVNYRLTIRNNNL